MFNFCGFCTQNDEKKHQLVIYDRQTASLFEQIVDSNSPELQMIKKVGTSFMFKSKFDKYLAQCRNKNKKFEDPEFPPSKSSLNFTSHREIVWKRVTEIIKKPVMVQGKIQPADIQQGNIGDCYFLAAISSLAQEKARIQKIFFNEMEIREEGIYRFAVANQGQLTQVFIDDYIPVYKGSDRPVFCKPNNNEVWVMLLEKVWAKLSGSYGQISKGYPHQVFNTFSLAPSFYYELGTIHNLQPRQKNEELQKIWQVLWQGHKQNFPMCAGSKSGRVCEGIKSSHSYSILKCFEIGKQKLLKLRNPWGDMEYKGRYSECDKQFVHSLTREQQSMLFGGQSENDGIFVVSFEEFIRNFQCVDISHDYETTRRNQYGYIFQTQNTYNQSEKFFLLQLDETIDTPFYITVEKSFDRKKVVKGRSQEEEKKAKYGYSKMLIAKKNTVENQTTYELVAAKLQNDFPDLSIQLRKLDKGEYIVMCQVEFHSDEKQHGKGSFTISTYGASKNMIKKITKPDRYFLQRVFEHHAIVQNPTRNYLNGQGDWSNQMFSLHDGGYGYFFIKLAEESEIKIKITCDYKKLESGGFQIKNQNEGMSNIYYEVSAGEEYILIFQALPHLDSDTVKFPPPGFKVAKII